MGQWVRGPCCSHSGRVRHQGSTGLGQCTSCDSFDRDYYPNAHWSACESRHRIRLYWPDCTWPVPVPWTWMCLGWSGERGITLTRVKCHLQITLVCVLHVSGVNVHWAAPAVECKPHYHFLFEANILYLVAMKNRSTIEPTHLYCSQYRSITTDNIFQRNQVRGQVLLKYQLYNDVFNFT